LTHLSYQEDPVETLAIRLILAALGLFMSARTQFHGVPVLWLAAAAVVLALAAAVLWLMRAIVRDGLNLRPRMVAR
jgi:hypothetical protein